MQRFFRWMSSIIYLYPQGVNQHLITAIAIVFLTLRLHGWAAQFQLHCRDCNTLTKLTKAVQWRTTTHTHARAHTHYHVIARTGRAAGYCLRKENSERLHQSCHQKSTCLLVYVSFSPLLSFSVCVCLCVSMGLAVCVKWDSPFGLNEVLLECGSIDQCWVEGTHSAEPE